MDSRSHPLQPGSTVLYLARPEWGYGRVLWVAPNGLLMVEFPEVPYIGEFHALEVEDAHPLEVAA